MAPHSPELAPGSGKLVVVVAAVLVVFGAAVVFAFTAMSSSPAPPSTPRAVAAPPQVAQARPVATPSVTPTPSVSRPAPVVAPAPVEPPPAVEPPPPEPAPVLADFQKLSGCGCKAAGGRPAIDLYARADGTTTLITNGGVSVEHAFVFALASGPDDLHVLATTDATAPATAYRRNFVTISMGCRDDVVLVAAGEHASAWSRTAGTLAWSQRLPGAHEGFRSEPRDDVVLDCGRLTPTKTDVPVRAGRRTVRLALADGTAK